MTTRKQIVICGDSYSYKDGIYGAQVYGKWPPTLTWVDLLMERHDVTYYSFNGHSNVQIEQQIPEDHNWDHLICSLGPVFRVEGNIDIDDSRVYANNMATGLRISKLPRCYLWSSFPEYRDLDWINYIPLRQHNEYFLRRDFPELYAQNHFKFTGCHLTEKGNRLLHAKICHDLNL